MEITITELARKLHEINEVLTDGPVWSMCAYCWARAAFFAEKNQEESK